MENARSMLSVVIIADKTDYGASETVCSALAQSYEPTELIYIDNTAQSPGMVEIAQLIRQHRKHNLQSVYIENNLSVKSYPSLCQQAQQLATGPLLVLLQAGFVFSSENALEQIAYNMKNQWAEKSYVMLPVFKMEEALHFLGSAAYALVLKKSKCAITSLAFKPASVPQILATCLASQPHEATLAEEAALLQWLPKKMNFSSGQRLAALCEQIENIPIENDTRARRKLFPIKRDQIEKMLTEHDSIQNMIGKLHDAEMQIHHRAVGCMWGISQSDKLVLFYIKMLSELLYAFKPEEKDALKTGARQLAAQIAQTTEGTVKVVFFAQEFSVWPSLDSVYKACAADERFIAQPVYVPFNMQLENGIVPETLLHPYWRANVPIIPYTMYDMAAESPDVAVFLKPYDLIPEAFSVNQVEKVAGRLLFIHYAMKATVEPEFLDYLFQLPLSAASWRVVGGNKSYNALAAKLGMRRGQNLANTAHPRVDAIRENAQNEGWPESWKPRQPGKIVVLYNANALVEPVTGSSTFFTYYKAMFQHFENQDELILVWRPHPRLQRRTCELGLMTESDWQQLYLELEAAQNIIVDRQESYLPALRLADALITDISTLLLEFYFLDRPALLLLSATASEQTLSEEFRVCSVAHTFEDVLQFCRHVLQGRDDFKEERQAFLKDTLYPTVVTAGEDIKNLIYEGLQTIWKTDVL